MSNISSFLKSIKPAIKKSPTETALCLISFVFSLIIKDHDLLLWTFYFPLYFAVTYYANKRFDSKYRFLYYLSILSPAIVILNGVFLLPDFLDDSTIPVSIFSAFMLMFLAKRQQNNLDFTKSALNIINNTIISVAFASMTILAVAACYYTIDILFGTDMMDSFDSVLKFGSFILFPILFMIGDKDEISFDETKIFTGFINYLLTPAFIIYAFILYSYFGKIIISWSLPNGIIATSSICFLLTAIAITAIRHTLSKTILNKLFENIIFVCLPAIILLWFSCIYRINEYGFTGDRIYLLMSAFILTLWIISTKIKIRNSYHILSCISVILFLTFTFSPYIGYTNIENKTKDKAVEEAKNLYTNISNYAHKTPKEYKISDYTNMYLSSAIDHEITENTLQISVKDSTLAEIDCDDIISFILKESKITDIDKDNFSSLKDNNLTYYKTDDYLVIFYHLNLTYNIETQKINLDHCAIDAFLY